MTLTMELDTRSYDIVIERGVLKKAGSLLNLNRKCLIVTGAMVPRAYSECIASQCREHLIVTVEPGEQSKSFPIYERLCRAMLAHDFHRGDCVIAVGGGVIGDLAGFAAASYMRGIDFYNLPTTVLSQVDSSIGGKVAINLDGVKNIVGAFWQPKKVLIDPDTLGTLPPRQIANGLAEAIKMACTSDAALFEFMETHDLTAHIDEIIAGSLRIKKAIVEQDETEKGLRKLLNFGHTIGHGIESTGALLHGECVALGMLPMCSDAVRARLLPVLEKAGLPASAEFDRAAVWEAMRHDKKAGAGSTDIVTVEEIGHGVIERVTTEQLKARFDYAYPEV